MGGQVIAGPSNSVVIDKNGMYWMAGKVQLVSLLVIICISDMMVPQWKNSGEGTYQNLFSV